MFIHLMLSWLVDLHHSLLQSGSVFVWDERHSVTNFHEDSDPKADPQVTLIGADTGTETSTGTVTETDTKTDTKRSISATSLVASTDFNSNNVNLNFNYILTAFTYHQDWKTKLAWYDIERHTKALRLEPNTLPPPLFQA